MSHGQMEFSPDIHSLLWTDERSGGIHYACLDGSHYREWPGDWHTQHFYWLGDSEHWVTLESDGPGEPFKRCLLRSVADRQEQMLPLPVNNILQGVFNTCQPSTEDGLLMDQTDLEGDKVKSVVFTEIALLPSYKRVRQIHVRHSFKGDIQEYALSTEGKRIAFIVHIEEAPSYLIQLHRLLPFIKAPVQSVFAIWSGPIEGGAITEVGHINLGPNAGDEGITDLKWLPDGKHVSFQYRDRLYTVSVL